MFAVITWVKKLGEYLAMVSIGSAFILSMTYVGERLVRAGVPFVVTTVLTFVVVYGLVSLCIKYRWLPNSPRAEH